MGELILRFSRWNVDWREQIYQVGVKGLTNEGRGEEIQEEHGESLMWGQVLSIETESY